MEDVGVQKFKNHDSHLLIASARELSHRAKPVLIFQFVPRDPLDHVQKFLCGTAFQFTKGLLLENRPTLLSPFRRALPEHQLSNLVKQGCRWFREISLQRIHSLYLSQ